MLALATLTSLHAGAGTSIGIDGKNFNQPGMESVPTSPFSAEISTGYDSRYMFRGMNIIPNTGVVWVEAAPCWEITPNDSITLPIWYATAVGKAAFDGFNQNYRELDIPVNYTHTFGNLSLGAGYLLYTYYNLTGATPGGTAVQNELNVNASYALKTGPLTWTPSLNYYYELGTAIQYSYGSIYAGSSFLSLALTVDIPLYRDILSFSPNTQYNCTFGYNPNSEGNALWGGNNWQITAPVKWQITKSIALTAYAAYSYQWRDLAYTAPSTFWGGGDITFSF